jgi:hypothetical protein
MTVDKLEQLDRAAQMSAGVPGNPAEAEFRFELARFWRSGGAELARDGIRYRWLREHGSEAIYVPVGNFEGRPQMQLAQKEALDAAIDAARQAGGEERG